MLPVLGQCPSPWANQERQWDWYRSSIVSVAVNLHPRGSFYSGCYSLCVWRSRLWGTRKCPNVLSLSLVQLYLDFLPPRMTRRLNEILITRIILPKPHCILVWSRDFFADAKTLQDLVTTEFYTNQAKLYTKSLKPYKIYKPSYQSPWFAMSFPTYCLLAGKSLWGGQVVVELFVRTRTRIP